MNGWMDGWMDGLAGIILPGTPDQAMQIYQNLEMQYVPFSLTCCVVVAAGVTFRCEDFACL